MCSWDIVWSMRQFSIALKFVFLLVACLWFVLVAGCSRPVSIALPSVKQHPVVVIPHHRQRAQKSVPINIHLHLRWRCEVSSGKLAWHSMGESLVVAQRKAKHLCEMFSVSNKPCRYKGCVQVDGNE